MEIAPDFFEYFEAAANLLDSDKGEKAGTKETKEASSKGKDKQVYQWQEKKKTPTSSIEKLMSDAFKLGSTSAGQAIKASTSSQEIFKYGYSGKADHREENTVKHPGYSSLQSPSQAFGAASNPKTLSHCMCLPLIDKIRRKKKEKKQIKTLRRVWIKPSH
ncbi:Alpha-1,3-mannosyl-glycoprotein 2-beta-N-acetylglucosaminyltransferase [Acorus calamus]|uniref:Alpha-1,3-mannosyl-glycoprotein 2-beta-N-acetylglucosaminyltransferase n=1 Tax=Acorus calamus TaxID=4465 RepID=A0AAV9EGE8_ACOCL|nr:Alpha-1,3-mannosyl-glycoprotein 2-beta-N-acetylglucosaminyltransferase [Acorus calamus]